MKLDELLKKEFYIIKCKDFIYYVQPAHIIGFGSCASDEELQYYLDVKDFMGRGEKMYMYELEKFKTFEEAQKERNDYKQRNEKAIEYISFVINHYKEQLETPIEDTYFNSDVNRKGYILSIIAYLQTILDTLIGSDNK